MHAVVSDRTPPPNVREEPIDALAHCRNPRCQGYGQQPVKAICQTVDWTFAAKGGATGGPMDAAVENSQEYLRFEDESEAPCPYCGHVREVARQERPTYDSLSGFSQDGLLGGPKFDPNTVNTPADAAMAEMQATIARQGELLEKLLKERGEA